MSNFADEYDSRTCAEFWDHLLRLEILGSEEEEPQGHYHDPEFKKRVIAGFLRERAAKRESSFGRVAAGPQQASETFLTKGDNETR